MANTVSYYYYAPTWDCPPEGGPIQLGNVLTALQRPDRPLHRAPAVPAFSSVKNDVEYSREKFIEGRFSILTTFLSMILGVGVDLSADWKNSQGEVYTFDRIETTQFLPTDAYIQSCIESAPVRRYLERSRYRKPVYIITGLKVVRGGARAKSHKTRAHGAGAGVALDGTVLSGGLAPVGVEPGVEARVENSKGAGWGGSSDFVFAFRVRKVRVRRRSSRGKKEGDDEVEIKQNDDYTKGAMLEERMGGGGNDDEIKGEDCDLVVLSDEDTEAGDEGYEEHVLTEGDGVVACAIPRDENSSSSSSGDE